MSTPRPLPTYPSEVEYARERGGSHASSGSRGGGPRSLAARAVMSLGADGPIARALAHAGVRYEARLGQLDMARAVGDAIENERVLLCEAGTGTGKTLAYLVPALLSGRRVVVSTATKALQEQIYAKDLPLLVDQLGVPVRAALMKGLANYVCLRRLGEARRAAHSFDANRAPQLARIEQWAKQSEVGDRAELDFLRDDDPAWRDVQSGSDTRIGQGCAYYDRCFVTKMRDAAQKARLLVVNHHLYLADLALRRGGARQGVIPDHDVVVFDEAHQLEEIATEFFGVRVSSARIDAVVRDARRSLLAAGALSGKKKAPHDSELDRVLDGVLSSSGRFFAELATASSTVPGADGRVHLRTDAWTGTLVEERHRLDAALEALAIASKRDGGEAQEELGVIVRRATTLRNDLARVASPGADDVAWIEVRSRSCAIGVSPIDLAPVLRDELFVRSSGRPQTIVLTSATLATGATGPNRFVHAKRRLGVIDGRPRAMDEVDDDVDPESGRTPSPQVSVDELLVPSPFDFEKRAGFYTPTDLPEPSDPAFVPRASERILELVRASGGGAFVLCTSLRNMRSFHHAIRAANLGLPLFCQGDAPKMTLLDGFRQAGDAVLVATMGFWEGVDVPGRALRLVVIDKLPFAIPTDPVVEARYRRLEEQGRSPFAELALPEAAISLKQGFGRLLRTAEDSGVVALLDRRIRTKSYGRVLVAALPPACTLRTLEQLRAFYECVVGVGGPARE